MADFDLITYDVRGMRDFKKDETYLSEKAQFKTGHHTFTGNTFY